MEELENHECADKNDIYPCEGEVRFMFDPYEEDVNGIQIPIWLCELHEYEHCMAI